MSRFHLKGLDTYRAISVIVVFVCHVELFKSRFGMSNFLKYDFFRYIGGITGVTLFFTLSGFLITYLLVIEKSKTNTISLKNFYLRRILRVWPLYFLIILISYLLIDYSPSFLTISLCLTIFPNIAHVLGAGWAVSPQIWSIGVEEQFYLFWPLIAKKSKNFLIIIILIFIIITALPHIILFLLNHFYPDPHIMSVTNKLFFGLKFNTMASGSFFAILYFKKVKIIEIVNKQLWLSYFLLIVPFYLWFSGFHMKYLNEELFSILFGISILVIASNTSIFNIDTKISLFLGKISYGIYMFHWIVLELMFRNKIFSNITENELLLNILIYTSTLSISIVVSSFSYYYIEKPFLKLKERYNR